MRIDSFNDLGFELKNLEYKKNSQHRTKNTVLLLANSYFYVF